MPLTALSPKVLRKDEGINIALLPPLSFLAGGVDVVVVNGAKRDGELIANLQAEPSDLRITNMMRVGGRTPADEAGLTCDEA